MELLEDSFRDRWKTLRRRLQNGFPLRDSPGARDGRVHDLRTASRRLLAVLRCIRAVKDTRAARRLAHEVKYILKSLGRLRDLAVERDTLVKLAPGRRTPLLEKFDQRLRQDYRRALDRSRRDLARAGLSHLQSQQHRISIRLERRVSRRRTRVRNRLLGAAAESLESLRDRGARIDPSRGLTIHQARVALKKFRYLLEAIAPELPGASEEALEALHALQTSMGDLHDLEVLSFKLTRYARRRLDRDPEELTPVLLRLESQHSRLLRSLLESLGPMLRFWSRILAKAARKA